MSQAVGRFWDAAAAFSGGLSAFSGGLAGVWDDALLKMNLTQRFSYSPAEIKEIKERC